MGSIGLKLASSENEKPAKRASNSRLSPTAGAPFSYYTSLSSRAASRASSRVLTLSLR